MNLTKIKESISKRIIGRETELTALTLALILKQHVLFVGGYGTAKSLLARMFFSSVDGGSIFKAQLRRNMTSDHIFGPMDIERYREGVIEHNTRGMLPDVTFAYLDEFFDANDGVLRSMLECLNERTFTCGGVSSSIPLHTAIATTNFYRVEDATQAVIDRFLFRVKVLPVSEKTSQEAMIDSYLHGGWSAQEKVGLAEVQEAGDYILDVGFPQEMKSTLIDLKNAYTKRRNSQMVISDRRLCWTVDILRASAFMRGCANVEIEDMQNARFGLCLVNDATDDAAFWSVFEEIVGELKKKAELPEKISAWKAVLSEAKKHDTKSSTKAMTASILELLRRTMDEIAAHPSFNEQVNLLKQLSRINMEIERSA